MYQSKLFEEMLNTLLNERLIYKNIRVKLRGKLYAFKRSQENISGILVTFSAEEGDRSRDVGNRRMSLDPVLIV